MIKVIYSFISKITNLITIIIFCVLFIAVQIGFNMNMPSFIEKTGGTLLDSSIWYNSELAYERLNSFSLAAKEYFNIRLIDFFYPAIYSTGLAMLSYLVYRKKYSDAENYHWILVVPFFAGIVDYIENIMLVILYKSLPAEFPAAASVLNIITLIKFASISLSILLIITGFFSLLKGGDSMLLMGNKFRGQKKEEP